MRGIVVLAVVLSSVGCGIGNITPRVTPTGACPVAIRDENPPEAAPAYASRARASAGSNTTNGTQPASRGDNALAVPVSAR